MPRKPQDRPCHPRHQDDLGSPELKNQLEIGKKIQCPKKLQALIEGAPQRRSQ